MHRVAVTAILPLAVLAALSVPGAAAGEVPDPKLTVAAFHEALKSGDREAALALLDPGCVVFEAGRAEMDRDEYAESHLGADMEFSGATRRKIVDQHSSVGDELAHVLTRSKTTGRFRRKAIDSEGVETIILARSGDGWRIVHIHWSSH